MKPNLKNSLFLLIVFIVVTTCIGQAQATELTFACENKQDFPTVMGNSEKVLDENPGMAVEAVRILEKKLSLKINIRRLPWKRCLNELEQGRVQGLFTISFKEKRKKLGMYPEKNGKVDPSRRFTSASYALYKLKGSDVNFDGTDFINITGRVGAPSGFSIVDDLKKRGLAVNESPSTEHDFKKMISGRLQAVAALEMNGDYYLLADKEFNKKIEKVTPLIVMKPYYFIVSNQFYKEKPQLAEKIFETIAEIREDPNFKKKLKNYIK